MGLIILGLVILSLFISYRFYVARKVSREVEPGWSRSTPSRRYSDGEDYLPTPRGVLAGFQFKSISLDVIIGPVIAIQFGWLPAILWLLAGAIFFGWVQDYLSTMISIRNEGRSLSDLIGTFFFHGSRPIILTFILMYLLIILGQFGMVLSTLLSRENVAISILFIAVAGFLAGFMIYRWQFNLVLATIISSIIALFGIWGSSVPIFQSWITKFNHFLSDDAPSLLQQPLSSSVISWETLIWLFILLLICYLGAVLPVWRFAVPFNYVSSWIVIAGLILAITGLFIGTLTGAINAKFEIPALVTTFRPNLGPIWPILFVTLSSGAVSGWHALVSTFSTSRQVEKEPMAMPITTGAMYGETILVAVVIIFAATFGVTSGAFNSQTGYSLVAGPASVLAGGMAKTLSALGFQESTGGTFSAVLLTLMGLTVLQLVLRIARLVASDLFGERIHLLRNPNLSTLLVIVFTLIIILFGFWQWMWVLFAGANQILAGLALLLASTWLAKQGKAYHWTLWPALFIFVTAIAALSYSGIYQPLVQQFLSGSEFNSSIFIGNLITIIFGILFIVMGCYLFLLGWRAFNTARIQSD
jgi:carbon starvation protein